MAADPMNVTLPLGVVIESPSDEEIMQAAVLGADMVAESPTYRNLETSKEQMFKFGYMARGRDDMFCKVAIDITGEVVGFIVAGSAPYGFGEGKYVYDRLVYVKPERRAGIVAKKMIVALEEWAREVGAIRVVLGITTGIHPERTTALYNALGYETVGALTMKELV